MLKILQRRLFRRTHIPINISHVRSTQSSNVDKSETKRSLTENKLFHVIAKVLPFDNSIPLSDARSLMVQAVTQLTAEMIKNYGSLRHKQMMKIFLSASKVLLEKGEPDVDAMLRLLDGQSKDVQTSVLTHLMSGKNPVALPHITPLVEYCIRHKLDCKMSFHGGTVDDCVALLNAMSSPLSRATKFGHMRFNNAFTHALAVCDNYADVMRFVDAGTSGGEPLSNKTMAKIVILLMEKDMHEFVPLLLELVPLSAVVEAGINNDRRLYTHPFSYYWKYDSIKSHATLRTLQQLFDWASPRDRETLIKDTIFAATATLDSDGTHLPLDELIEFTTTIAERNAFAHPIRFLFEACLVNEHPDTFALYDEHVRGTLPTEDVRHNYRNIELMRIQQPSLSAAEFVERLHALPGVHSRHILRLHPAAQWTSKVDELTAHVSRNAHRTLRTYLTICAVAESDAATALRFIDGDAEVAQAVMRTDEYINRQGIYSFAHSIVSNDDTVALTRVLFDSVTIGEQRRAICRTAIGNRAPIAQIVNDWSEAAVPILTRRTAVQMIANNGGDLGCIVELLDLSVGRLVDTDDMPLMALGSGDHKIEAALSAVLWHERNFTSLPRHVEVLVENWRHLGRQGDVLHALIVNFARLLRTPNVTANDQSTSAQQIINFFDVLQENVLTDGRLSCRSLIRLLTAVVVADLPDTTVTLQRILRPNNYDMIYWTHSDGLHKSDITALLDHLASSTTMSERDRTALLVWLARRQMPGIARHLLESIADGEHKFFTDDVVNDMLPDLVDAFAKTERRPLDYATASKLIKLAPNEELTMKIRENAAMTIPNTLLMGNKKTDDMEDVDELRQFCRRHPRAELGTIVAIVENYIENGMTDALSMTSMDEIHVIADIVHTAVLNNAHTMSNVNTLTSLIGTCLYEFAERTADKNVLLATNVAFLNVINDLIHDFMPNVEGFDQTALGQLHDVIDARILPLTNVPRIRVDCMIANGETKECSDWVLHSLKTDNPRPFPPSSMSTLLDADPDLEQPMFSAMRKSSTALSSAYHAHTWAHHVCVGNLLRAAQVEKLRPVEFEHLHLPRLLQMCENEMQPLSVDKLQSVFMDYDRPSFIIAQCQATKLKMAVLKDSSVESVNKRIDEVEMYFKENDLKLDDLDEAIIGPILAKVDRIL